jgi:hypothetical protein
MKQKLHQEISSTQHTPDNMTNNNFNAAPIKPDLTFLSTRPTRTAPRINEAGGIFVPKPILPFAFAGGRINMQSVTTVLDNIKNPPPQQHHTQNHRTDSTITINLQHKYHTTDSTNTQNINQNLINNHDATVHDDQLTNTVPDVSVYRPPNVADTSLYCFPRRKITHRNRVQTEVKKKRQMGQNVGREQSC